MATIIIPEVNGVMPSQRPVLFPVKKLLGALRNTLCRPPMIAKPEEIRLPERVWRRHSALIMSMQEHKQYEAQ